MMSISATYEYLYNYERKLKVSFLKKFEGVINISFRILFFFPHELVVFNYLYSASTEGLHKNANEVKKVMSIFFIRVCESTLFIENIHRVICIQIIYMNKA